VLSNRHDKGSQSYTRGLGGAMSRTNDMARKSGMSGAPMFYAGWVWNERDLSNVLADGDHIQTARGRAVAFIQSWLLQSRGDNDMQRLRDSFSALVVVPGSPVFPRIEAFTKTTTGQPVAREVFFEFHTPDVYMMGFYAFGMGVQGWFCSGLYMRPGPYSGWGFNSPGYIVPEPEMGQLSPTVAILRARQGQSDFLLARRADEVAGLAKKHNVDAGELPALLASIRTKARDLQGIGPDRLTMRTATLSPKELDDLRKQLLAATADVVKNLPKK